MFFKEFIHWHLLSPRYKRGLVGGFIILSGRGILPLFSLVLALIMEMRSGKITISLATHKIVNITIAFIIV